MRCGVACGDRGATADACGVAHCGTEITRILINVKLKAKYMNHNLNFEPNLNEKFSELNYATHVSRVRVRSE